MFTLGTITTALGFIVTNLPAFEALGVDAADAFEKGKALVTGGTIASTPEERATAMAEIEALETRRDARLEELRQQAPNS